MVEGWRNLACSAWRRERAGPSLIMFSQYLKSRYRKDGDILFKRTQWQDKRECAWSTSKEIASGYKKMFFTVGTTKHWNRLSLEVAEPPLLEVFRTCLAGTTINIVQNPAFNWADGLRCSPQVLPCKAFPCFYTGGQQALWNFWNRSQRGQEEAEQHF